MNSQMRRHQFVYQDNQAPLPHRRITRPRLLCECFRPGAQRANDTPLIGLIGNCRAAVLCYCAVFHQFQKFPEPGRNSNDEMLYCTDTTRHKQIGTDLSRSNNWTPTNVYNPPPPPPPRHISTVNTHVKQVSSQYYYGLGFPSESVARGGGLVGWRMGVLGGGGG